MKAKELHKKQDSSPIKIRERARQVAEKYIEVQKESFTRWGVIGDWASPYRTFDNDYVAQQIRAFGELHAKGLIERDLWPVHWSYATKTALAEAELEYNEEHRSRTVYASLDLQQLSATVADVVAGAKCRLVVWTTTPWTLPGNKAVAYHPTLEYVLLKNADKECFIVLSSFKETLEHYLGASLSVMKSFQGSALDGCTFGHPVLAGESGPLLGAEYVTDEKGTGLVHVAPAHGREDFQLGLSAGLDLASLVDEDGCYTAGASSSLEGLHVLTDGTEKVLSLLESQGQAVHQEDIVHSYPYDWRSKTPVITRSSEQWFLNTHLLGEKAVEEYSKVKVYPERMAGSMHRFISDRPRWCISRQRCWGVPIPVFYRQDGRPILHQSLINHFADRMAKEGCDFWWHESPSEMIPEEFEKQLDIPPSGELRKGTDIFDIWLDSGLSWRCGLDAGNVADVYIEGQDQFRGWFSSSLLLSVALQGRAPYKSVLVHGFTTDENGQKMSKSLGNVVDPDAVVDEFGVDLLRYWVCSAGLDPRSQIGGTLLTNMNANLKLVRNVFRFVLGNLHDFGADDTLPADQLLLHDRHQLAEAARLEAETAGLYAAHSFSQVPVAVEQFAAALSNFYFTAVKDRLYCDPPAGRGRRAAQTVLQRSLRALLPVLAPVLPHLTEEVFQHWRRAEAEAAGSLLETLARDRWPPGDFSVSIEERRAMELGLRLREAATAWAVAKGKKSPSAVWATVRPRSAAAAALLELAHPAVHNDDGAVSSHSALCEIVRCSRVTVLRPGTPLPPGPAEDCVLVAHADADCELALQLADRRHSCPRCRRATKVEAEAELCPRCSEAVRTPTDARRHGEQQ